MQFSRITIVVVFLLTLNGCANGVKSSSPPIISKPESSLREFAQAPVLTAGNETPFCPVEEIYMVMPEEGGVGVVDVKFKDGSEVTLEGDYSALSLAGGSQNAYTSNEQEKQALFQESLAALPTAPFIATLYFELGKDVLTAQSAAEKQGIYRQIQDKEAPEVIIVGHTDTVGNVDYNYKLSQRRAEKVKKELIASGIPADAITIVPKGETELYVATADGVKEQLNRRVVLEVR